MGLGMAGGKSAGSFSSLVFGPGTAAAVGKTSTMEESYDNKRMSVTHPAATTTIAAKQTLSRRALFTSSVVFSNPDMYTTTTTTTPKPVKPRGSTYDNIGNSADIESINSGTMEKALPAGLGKLKSGSGDMVNIIGNPPSRLRSTGSGDLIVSVGPVNRVRRGSAASSHMSYCLSGGSTTAGGGVVGVGGGKRDGGGEETSVAPALFLDEVVEVGRDDNQKWVSGTLEESVEDM
ncbi:hypothetical protein HDU76_005353 [Blyttiomyces sp. JEL0837]|nr:hypothetical protein HDU76_005353 [Blyttiomyces sp. JEL0837]